MRRWEKALVFGFLAISVTLFVFACTLGARAYTGTANVTSATIGDMRVNPSQSVTWAPGPVLNATGQPVGGGNSSLSFDGLNDYVYIPYDLTLDGFTSITVEFWFYPTSLADGTYRYVLHRGWGTDGGLIFYTDAISSKICFGVAPTWATSKQVGATLPTANTWYHIVGTWTSGEGQIIYVNTVPTSTSATTGTLTNAAGLTIAGDTNDLKGTLDEMRIYKNRVLTPTEILQHYQGVYLDETGLVLYLDFDGQALDQSGTGNDGTLNGGPTYTDGWASVPISTYFNATQSVNSRRILVNSTDGTALSTIPDTAPATWGNYTATLAPDTSIGNATAAPFLVDTYTIDVYTVHPEIDAGFNTLLYAEAESRLDDHSLADGDALTVEGAAFSWNEYTGRFEATDSESTPQTRTYDTLTALAEATYGITSGAMNVTATVTWVTPQIDVVQTFLATGDILGAVYVMATAQLGGLVFWTFIMTGISLAVYNYTGPEATLLAWILGWGTFSVVIHGEAVGIALILLALGGGLLIAKMLLDRRAA